MTSEPAPPRWPPVVPLPLLLGAHCRVPEMAPPASSVLTASWHLDVMSKSPEKESGATPGPSAVGRNARSRRVNADTKEPPWGLSAKMQRLHGPQSHPKGVVQALLEGMAPGTRASKTRHRGTGRDEGREGTCSSHRRTAGCPPSVPGQVAHCPRSRDTRLAATLSPPRPRLPPSPSHTLTPPRCLFPTQGSPSPQTGVSSACSKLPPPFAICLVRTPQGPRGPHCSAPSWASSETGTSAPAWRPPASHDVRERRPSSWGQPRPCLCSGCHAFCNALLPPCLPHWPPFGDPSPV